MNYSKNLEKVRVERFGAFNRYKEEIQSQLIFDLELLTETKVHFLNCTD